MRHFLCTTALLCCLSACTSTCAGRSTSSVASELASIANRFDASEASGCRDVCCRGPKPSWLVLEPSIEWEAPTEPVPVEALRRVLASSTDPRILGLALLWLASAAEPDDVPRFDAYLDDTRPAAALPWAALEQGIVPCISVGWDRPSVGQVALEAASFVADTPIATHADVAAWRAANPSAATSFEHWAQHIEALRPLMRKNPELFVRVATMADTDGRYLNFRDDELVKAALTVFGSAKLLRMLEGVDSYPDLNVPQRAYLFRTWVLRRATDLFDKSAVPVLLRLWQTRALIAFADPELYARLALAIVKLAPSLTLRVAAETLAATPPSMSDGELVEPLLRDHFDTTRAVIATAAGQPGRHFLRRSVYQAIRAMGPSGLPRAKAILPSIPRVVLEHDVEDIVRVAQAVDPTLALPEAHAINERYPELTKSPGDLTERAGAARADCIDRILARLR